jgi:hypothetical protein
MSLCCAGHVGRPCLPGAPPIDRPHSLSRLPPPRIQRHLQTSPDFPGSEAGLGCLPCAILCIPRCLRQDCSCSGQVRGVLQCHTSLSRLKGRAPADLPLGIYKAVLVCFSQVCIAASTTRKSLGLCLPRRPSSCLSYFSRQLSTRTWTLLWRAPELVTMDHHQLASERAAQLPCRAVLRAITEMQMPSLSPTMEQVRTKVPLQPLIAQAARLFYC